MDANKFMTEYQRMCASYTCCRDCPLYTDNEQCIEIPSCFTKEFTDKVIKIVEDWSTAHPRKTRLDVFLEQHAQEKLNANEVLDLCPITSDVYEYGSGHCKNTDRSCGFCRRDFWMQEVE